MPELAGWGRVPRVRVEELVSEDLEWATRDAVLTRGLGRSYGDSSLPPEGRGPVAGSRLADRIVRFDEESGVLRAEAGFSLAKLNRLMLPRGWSCPVVPGTQFVTLGGMVASDIHGKNHHVAGCIGEHVRSLRMRVADGRILEVGPSERRELFEATVGGMGLTGHILEVELALERIPSPWIRAEHETAGNLEALIEKLQRDSATWPFTVAWVDTASRGASLGRGVLIRGRWAEPGEAPGPAPGLAHRGSVPFDLPSFVLNRWSIAAFNAVYFRVQGRGPGGKGIVSPQPFFHPLDGIGEWNRLYGRGGFVQYQCVLPRGTAPALHRRVFEVLHEHDEASFLTVIKDCGAQGRGMLSFPMPGISIALDIPMRGPKTQRLVDALNVLVAGAGGRMYLTKDALTREEHFLRMEPRLEAWNAVRRTWDPEGRIVSAQSCRLFGDRP